jgi:hypothetical protein
MASDARWLTSARGRDALEEARGTRAHEPLARRSALEKRFTGAEARAALAQDDLRVRARAKTEIADALLFTREALEQASAGPVARERAERFAEFETVADLGAGIGLDTIALAKAGKRVVAVERDAERVALLRHNVAAAGVAEQVEVVEHDFLANLPHADAAFLDPDRRPAGKRTHSARVAAPPASAWPGIAARYRGLLVKLAPATTPGDAQGSGLEWVSLDGEMREARAGFGALRLPVARRALVLPHRAALEGGDAPAHWPAARTPECGDVLLDPDPAVVLAGLVGEGAREAGARPVHPRIAYLVGPREAPWARCDRVLEVLPASRAAVEARLRALGVGDLEVRSRGVEGTADAWRRGLRLRGSARATVVRTRGPDDRYLVLLVEPGVPPVAAGAGISGRAAGMP